MTSAKKGKSFNRSHEEAFVLIKLTKDIKQFIMHQLTVQPMDGLMNGRRERGREELIDEWMHG